MDKIQELDAKIEELKKEKEIALLELEIKKIKKTAVEEISVNKVIIEKQLYPYERQYLPWFPTPAYPNFNKYNVTC